MVHEEANGRKQTFDALPTRKKTWTMLSQTKKCRCYQYSPAYNDFNQFIRKQLDSENHPKAGNLYRFIQNERA